MRGIVFGLLYMICPVVQMKSGGAKMLIDGHSFTGDGQDYYKCIWMDDNGNMRENTFKRQHLKVCVFTRGR